MNTLLFASYLALSQAKPTVTHEPDETSFKRVTLIQFSDLDISGEIVKPEATLIQSRIRARFRSLIRYRGDFRPELISSIDNL